jgi:acetolactate synthase-1/3 small subunit
MSGDIVDNIVRGHNGRILEVTPEYMVIEKTGHKAEINELLHQLEPCGILQYVRSGRVAITRQVKELNAYLEEMDEANQYKPDKVESFN